MCLFSLGRFIGDPSTPSLKGIFLKYLCMLVAQISFLIIVIMPRQTIGDLKSQTRESPVFVGFTQAMGQKGQEEGNRYLSMDSSYHSNSHRVHSDGVVSTIHLSSPIRRREGFLSLLSFCLGFLNLSLTLSNTETPKIFPMAGSREREII